MKYFDFKKPIFTKETRLDQKHSRRDEEKKMITDLKVRLNEGAIFNEENW